MKLNNSVDNFYIVKAGSCFQKLFSEYFASSVHESKESIAFPKDFKKSTNHKFLKVVLLFYSFCNTPTVLAIISANYFI